MKFASRKVKARKLQLAALERKLKHLEANLHLQTLFEDTQQQIELVKKDIEIILEEKTRGAMIRSWANWVEWGEKTSKYFLNLEKHNYNSLRVLKRDFTGVEGFLCRHIPKKI